MIYNLIRTLFFFSSILISQQTVGLIYNDTTAAYNGYTLFAPQSSLSTFLIDNEGRLVNRWESEYVPGLSAYFLEDGYLLRSAAVEDPDGVDGRTGGFQKFDWENNLVWEFYYGTQHHDIEQLPNGNVLLIVNDTKLKNAAIQAGRNPDSIAGNNIRSLSILEVSQTGQETGEIVWQWNAWDHLIQDFDNLKDNYGIVAEHPELIDINFASGGAQDWLHTNSISYNNELDQILVSNRNTNEIWIIDHSITTWEAATHEGGNNGKGGDLLYRWGNPVAYKTGTDDDRKLYGQHDAHWIETGLPGASNILIFSNGFSERGYSTVDEIEPPINVNGYYELLYGAAYQPFDQTWVYTANTPEDFNSPRYGGSQRLPNGNTLICNSDGGEFFEVTSEKEIVWKYINPVSRDRIYYQGETEIDHNHVFRCYRYDEHYPGLAGKDLTPGDPIELYPTIAINDEQSIIAKFRLYDNYPNPFNPSTMIQYDLPEATQVTVAIYDLMGSAVKTLVNEFKDAGYHTVTWNGTNDRGNRMSGGVYLYSINAGPYHKTQKMVLLK
ncbi:MAG: aryl-sulfate sulfotransferase [Candidatus Neomarinimicrobiota bacterium]